MYYLCEKYYKPITVQYCIADCVSCRVFADCVAYEQIELMNALLEWNSFVCRGCGVYSSKNGNFIDVFIDRS